MGLSGLSIGHLLVVLVVVALVFGTKRLGSLGADLGEAVKGFRKAMAGHDEPQHATVQTSGAVTTEPAAAAKVTEAAPASPTEPPAGHRP
jgi:sec-independent protein translocase protein TatA